MKVSLYELTNEFMELEELASTEEFDDDTVLDTWLGIDAEIEDKADGIAKVIASLKGTSGILKAEEERISSRRKAIDNNIEHLKKYLQNSMEITGKVKFKTDLFSFGIQNNPASVVIDDPTSVPEKFLIQQEPKIDKMAIKEALKEGELPYAHLYQSKSLRIR